MEELEDPLGDPYKDLRKELDDPYAAMRRELKEHETERDADIKKFFHHSQSSNNENKFATKDSDK